MVLLCLCWFCLCNIHAHKPTHVTCITSCRDVILHTHAYTHTVMQKAAVKAAVSLANMDVNNAVFKNI